MQIDIDALRDALIDYFGTAQMNEYAQADLVYVETCSPQELINIALNNNFDLSKFEINIR